MAGLGGTMFTGVIAGSQVIMHGVRMFRQYLRILLIVGILVVGMGSGIASYLHWQNHPQQVKAALFYGLSTKLGIFNARQDRVFRFTRPDGSPGQVTAATVMATPAFERAWDRVLGHLLTGAIYGAWTLPAVYLLMSGIFGWQYSSMTRARHLKGASKVSPKIVARMTGRAGPLQLLKRKPHYSIAGIPWPDGGETRHTMLVGTTGAGKTVALLDLVDQIRSKHGKAVIYDKMGNFTRYFYDPKRDIILNPLDERAHDWDMFREVRHPDDWDMLAEALIPTFKGTAEPFWTLAARQLFSSGGLAWWKAGRFDTPGLVASLLKTTLEDLAKSVEGTVEQGIIDESNPRTALSVRAQLTTNLKVLADMPKVERPFSIRKWVEEAEDSILFLTSTATGHANRRAMIAAQMEVATISILSLQQSFDQRIWNIIDELPTMEQIPSLDSGLRESRQFGGCYVIGTQVFSEIRDIYGRDQPDTDEKEHQLGCQPGSRRCRDAATRGERQYRLGERDYGTPPVGGVSAGWRRLSCCRDQIEAEEAPQGDRTASGTPRGDRSADR